MIPELSIHWTGWLFLGVFALALLLAVGSLVRREITDLTEEDRDAE